MKRAETCGCSLCNKFYTCLYHHIVVSDKYTHSSLVYYKHNWMTNLMTRELILEPCLGAKNRFLSFDTTQSMTVTDLRTGHNTLRRHLQLMGL